MDGMDDNIHSPHADKNVKQKIVWDLDISKNPNMKQLSKAEILKKRKERFGEMSPPRSKYNKISHKQGITMNSSNGTNSNVLQKHSGHVDSATVGGVDINVLKKRSERFGESVSTLMKKLEDKDKMKMRQARFSSTIPISPATVSENLIVGPRLNTPTTVKLFKTIDQIEAERRVKLYY